MDQKRHRFFVGSLAHICRNQVATFPSLLDRMKVERYQIGKQSRSDSESLLLRRHGRYVNIFLTRVQRNLPEALKGSEGISE